MIETKINVSNPISHFDIYLFKLEAYLLFIYVEESNIYYQIMSDQEGTGANYNTV